MEGYSYSDAASVANFAGICGCCHLEFALVQPRPVNVMGQSRQKMGAHVAHAQHICLEEVNTCLREMQLHLQVATILRAPEGVAVLVD